MSGHSKWATIKRKKEKTDAARGKVFTKIVRELAVAVKEGGGPDPSMNPRLRDTIAKAKANNMPNDNIDRAIKKASGELGNINYENITYEGYGVGGVAVIIDVLTDNKNRTAAEIRHALSKNGGSLGTTGCVAWMFDAKGVITVEQSEGVSEEELMMTALDAGAEDFNAEDGVYEILTDPADFSQVREALEAAGYAFLSAEMDKIPQTSVELTAEQQRKAEENMGLVGKVIADKVHGTYFGSYTREDLFQIGCIGLCKAAATDKGGCFSTYAYRLIWNEICTALISATRKASGEQPTELPILEIQGAQEKFASTLELEDLLERGERTAKGVAKKGIQALRLRLKGYSTREIGACLGAPDNYVTAWEAKARSYLRAMQ